MAKVGETMKELQEIKLIRTELGLRGDGKEKNPYRRIIQYWTHDGKLILEYDPYLKKVTNIDKEII